MGHYLSEMENPEPAYLPKKKEKAEKKVEKMKRKGSYFVQITHWVYVIYKGKKYQREECIIDGQVSLFWKTWKNINDDCDKYESVTNQKEINELNKAYADMSYSENFK